MTERSLQASLKRFWETDGDLEIVHRLASEVRRCWKQAAAAEARADRLAAALPPLLADCWRCKGTGRMVICHSDNPEEVRTAPCPRCGPAREALAGEQGGA